MLSGIGVNNYRSFLSEAQFDIAPITIFLGANSCGKSSITRLMPLFSQSLSNKISGPILWVSDYLDYGSFADNVTNGDTQRNITFKFRGDANFLQELSPFRFSRSQERRNDFCFSIDISGGADDTEISSIGLEIFGHKLSLAVDEGGMISDINLDGAQIKGLLGDRVGLFRDGLIPNVTFFRNSDGDFSLVDSSEFAVLAAGVLHKYAHKKLSRERIAASITSIPPSGVDALFELIRRRTSAALSNRLSAISKEDRIRVWLFHVFANINGIISGIRESISRDLNGGGYLGPIRAEAARYYRRQDLAIDQIDPSGKNLAMYFNSLDTNERREINQEFSKFFGHTIRVLSGEGHISLRILADGSQHEDNLADVGFGFSQLLPVLAQVHAAGRSLKGVQRFGGPVRPDSPILAVEQPELHLHPAFQARLGAYFVHAATQVRGGMPPFRFVIETHSEPLVNEVASLIGRGAISPEQVRIYLFERRSGEEGTRVVRANLQSDGSISNWPFGFFTTGRLEIERANP